MNEQTLIVEEYDSEEEKFKAKKKEQGMVHIVGRERPNFSNKLKKC